MAKKQRNKGKSSIKTIRKVLFLFGVAVCVFIAALGFLFYAGKVDKTVFAYGVFEPYPKIEIKAAIKDTVIDKILVEVGEDVGKGQILMRLKDQEQNKETIAQLKERLKLANMDFDRMSQLYDKGYVAARDKEEANLKIKILEQDAIALQRRGSALAIAAPFSGKVEELPVEIGDAVDLGKKLVLLGSSEERALRIWIKEEDSSEVGLGQKVRICSQIFYYRRYGVALGNIVEIDRCLKVKGKESYVEALVRIKESPFPIKIGSRAKARIVIKRCPILKLLFGLE